MEPKPTEQWGEAEAATHANSKKRRLEDNRLKLAVKAAKNVLEAFEPKPPNVNTYAARFILVLFAQGTSSPRQRGQRTIS